MEGLRHPLYYQVTGANLFRSLNEVIYKSSLNIAADALYVRKYFKKDAKESAQELVANIRAEFKETLKSVDWMDEVTRKEALKKADMMVEYIGYPNELLDDTKLEEYYQDVREYFYCKKKLILNMFRILVGSE